MAFVCGLYDENSFPVYSKDFGFYLADSMPLRYSWDWNICI
jgi:hypothetical protein